MKIKFNWPNITITTKVTTKKRPTTAIKGHAWQIALTFSLISLAAWIFYYSQDLTLSYNDARSHLNVARRVFDNLQPGFAQIGSVWLPLYHLLELPLIWNNFLWQTGVAGSLISMAAYVLGGYYLFKLCQALNFNWPAALISLAVYAFNPNLLFMQTTPMTESLLLFLAIAVIYHLVAWVKEEHRLINQNLPTSTSAIIHLVAAAFFSLLSTLTRYDGWFLLAFSGMAVGFLTYKFRGYKQAEGNFLLYCTLGGFGVLLWLGWNWLIFGDPFYFALGPFSAKAQQDVLQAQGRLLTKGNPIYSLFVYLLVSQKNIGLWISLLSLAGAGYLLLTKDYTSRIKIILSLLLVPLIFNVFSLIAGHSVIYIPELPPFTWFNDRYGLMMLPAAAILTGLLAQGRRLAGILIAIVLFVQTFIMYNANQVITIEDGVRGASADFLENAGEWIQNNIKDQGLILAAASSNDALLFRSGLPLKRFIVEGAREYWIASLEDPTMHAEWIVMHKGDLVERALRENPKFLYNYRLVYQDSFTHIYKQDLGRLSPIEEENLP